MLKQMVLGGCFVLGFQLLYAAEPTSLPARPIVSRILSNSDSVQQCYGHVHRCIVPVYVHTSLPTTSYPELNGQCSAWIDPALIKVKQPDHSNGTDKIKVIFVLRKGDANTDLRQFSFDPNVGVAPLDNTQPADQFASEGYDAPDGSNSDPDDGTAMGPLHRRFRWASTGTVGTQGVKFIVTVYRHVGNVILPCISADPTITNTN